MPIDAEQVGKILREQRQKLGIKQTELSEKLGISQGYIADLENGKMKNPTLDTLLKITSALNLSSGLILGSSILFDYTKTPSSSDGKVVDEIDNAVPVSCKFVHIPVLGSIPAGIPVEARENIVDYVSVQGNEVTNGEYFYLIVKGDSMIGSRIYDGDRVLVRKQCDVENGEIAVVRVNSYDATLKRVKRVDEKVMLYPDNPAYDPIIVCEESAEIIGRVVKVEFDPNKKKR